jgi:hypothetical protein
MKARAFGPGLLVIAKLLAASAPWALTAHSPADRARYDFRDKGARMRILLALSLVLVLAGPVDAILVEGTLTAGIPSDFAPIMDLRGEEGFSLRTGANSRGVVTYQGKPRSPDKLRIELRRSRR